MNHFIKFCKVNYGLDLSKYYREYIDKSQNSGASIVLDCCKTLGISKKLLLSSSRNHQLVTTRVVIARILRSYNLTLDSIGQLLRKNHSTIIYYLKVFETYNESQTYKFFVETLKTLAKKYDILQIEEPDSEQE